MTRLNRWLLGHATPPPEAVDPLLGAGDLVEVSVFRVPELSQLKFRIPGSGQITLPLVGAVPASGLTVSQLGDAITTRLRTKYMQDPQVSVFVLEHRSQQISVFGSVKNAGVYPLMGPYRVTDALAMAGALADDADHVIYVIRPASSRSAQQPPSNGQAGAGGELMFPIDLETLATDGADINLMLQPGDVIHVPRAGSYYVGGEVLRPGSFTLRTRTTLHQAIVGAGGMTLQAQWGDLRVYRPGPNGQTQVLRYSLEEFEEGQGSPEIMKNDIVVVGKSEAKAFGYGFLNFIRFGVGATLAP